MILLSQPGTGVRQVVGAECNNLYKNGSHVRTKTYEWLISLNFSDTQFVGYIGYIQDQ